MSEGSRRLGVDALGDNTPRPIRKDPANHEIPSSGRVRPHRRAAGWECRRPDHDRHHPRQRPGGRHHRYGDRSGRHHRQHHADSTSDTTRRHHRRGSGESTRPRFRRPTTSTEPAAADPGSDYRRLRRPPAAPAPAAKPAKNDWAKATLDKLVADGTITQAQADKVLAALDAARPAHGPGKGGRGHGFGKLDAAASVLGMSVEDLRTALQSGKSLAAIAGEKGINVAKVVDALVAELKTHLAEHVSSGKNTQAEVDQMLADARTRIEAFVNGTAPAGGPGFGFGPGGGRGGHHGPRGGAPANGTAPSSTASSSGTTIS